MDVIKKFMRLFNRRERWQLLGLFLAILFSSIFQALGVVSILPFMNIVMEPGMIRSNYWLNWLFTYFDFASTYSFIFFLGIIMLLIIVLGNGFSAFSTWLKLTFVWRKNHSLSRRLLQRYLSHPYSYFLQKHTADLSKNILTEINLLTNGFLIPLMNLTAKSVMTILILLTLIAVEPVISIFAVILLGGAYSLVYLSYHRKLGKRGRARLLANKERYKTAGDALGSIKEVKVTGREYFFLQRYARASHEFSRQQAWSSIVGQIPRYALETLAFGSVVLLILILLYLERGLDQIVPLISLYAFAGYRLMPALQEIFRGFTQIRFNKATLSRIYRDFREKDLLHDRAIKAREKVAPMPFQKEICLEGISFKYAGQKEKALHDVSLTIGKNTAVAIVGSTGAGKTTLVDIILGLLFPQEGRILVDGEEIGRDNILCWQSILGYVPQSIYLFDDTVTRNIAFGVPDDKINEERVREAARIANIHDFIENELPQEYETEIGERGMRLSGGQKQRLGIARALYRDPEVLILDEATSALDSITEKAVLGAIENVARTKTLIIIAHRLTTIKKCQVIYFLEGGRISAKGSFAELMSSSPKFKELAREYS